MVFQESKDSDSNVKLPCLLSEGVTVDVSRSLNELYGPCSHSETLKMRSKVSSVSRKTLVII